MKFIGTGFLFGLQNKHFQFRESYKKCGKDELGKQRTDLVDFLPQVKDG